MEELNQTISDVVTSVLFDKQQTVLPELTPEMRLVGDLGLDSMDLAVIVATLEQRTGTDPFAERVAIASVQTVGDLVSAYSA